MKNKLIILIILIACNHTLYAKEFIPYKENRMSIEKKLSCSIAASVKFNVPIDVLLAISSIENGNIDTISKNNNNTFDYGVMQINSDYIKDLNNKYNLNLTYQDFLKDDCFSFEVAAFKIKEHIKNDSGDLLTRIAMYHSKTYKFNEIYKHKLIDYCKYWSDYLNDKGYKLYLFSEIQ